MNVTLTVRVAAMRHGEKSGDQLTERGKEQVAAAVNALSCRFSFRRIIYSGTNRTKQTAEIAAEILGIAPETIVQTDEFYFGKVMNDNYATKEDCIHDIEALQAEHDGSPMVSDALAAPNAYARQGREVVTTAILDSATKAMTDFHDPMVDILTAAHSEYLELAAVNPENQPYGLDECDVVVYTVLLDVEMIDGKVVHVTNKRIATSEHLRAPYPTL